MDINSFNTLAERVNREYFYTLFGTPQNESSSGIDFIDHKRKIAVELKGAVATNGLDVHNFSFKIGVNQIDDYPRYLSDYNLFWAFMPFELKIPIIDIATSGQIRDSIGNREILLFPWNHIDTFDLYYEQDKKFMKLTRSRLDREFTKKLTPSEHNCTIQYHTTGCEMLLEAFRNGPYIKNPEQIIIKLE